MTKTNLTFEQAITNGKLAYYYWLYEATSDMCCEQCAFKMGYDPDGNVFCYGQSLIPSNRNSKYTSVNSLIYKRGEGLSFSLFLCYKF